MWAHYHQHLGLIGKKILYQAWSWESSIADHTQWLTAQVRNPPSGKYATNKDAKSLTIATFYQVESFIEFYIEIQTI